MKRGNVEIALIEGVCGNQPQLLYTPRRCSVVDYVAMSADLYSSAVEFSIGELPLYSDHCPLHLVLTSN